MTRSDVGLPARQPIRFPRIQGADIAGHVLATSQTKDFVAKLVLTL